MVFFLLFAKDFAVGDFCVVFFFLMEYISTSVVYFYIDEMEYPLDHKFMEHQGCLVGPSFSSCLDKLFARHRVDKHFDGIPDLQVHILVL